MNEDLLEVAVFGRQVEDFLNSEIGKYLMQHFENQAFEAMTNLKKVSPWRRRKIQELQNKICLAESFRDCLSSAILDGIQSLKVLEDEHG